MAWTSDKAPQLPCESTILAPLVYLRTPHSTLGSNILTSNGTSCARLSPPSPFWSATSTRTQMSPMHSPNLWNVNHSCCYGVSWALALHARRSLLVEEEFSVSAPFSCSFLSFSFTRYPLSVYQLTCPFHCLHRDTSDTLLYLGYLLLSPLTYDSR